MIVTVRSKDAQELTELINGLPLSEVFPQEHREGRKRIIIESLDSFSVVHDGKMFHAFVRVKMTFSKY